MQDDYLNEQGGHGHGDGEQPAAPVFAEPDPEDKTVMHADAVASVQTTAINIVSNVVGAGILSIPGGFAGMSMIPATIMLTLFAFASAYSMLLLTVCAQRTSRFTYKDLIEYAFKSKVYGRLFDGAIFIYTFACCIAYAHSVGDAMGPVMQSLTGKSSIVTSSGFWILMASLIFFPLSSMKQLSELKVSSLFGFLVIVYLVIVVVIYFFTHKAPGGTLVNDTVSWFDITTKFLTNVPICSVAFSCHYNIPAFYGEMRHRSPTRMMGAVKFAVPFIYCLYMITAYFSDLHFDMHELIKKGDISLNFPDSYIPMTVARIGLFIHFVCVFPIICIATRRALNSIVFNRGNMPRLVYVAEAFGLVAVACLLAWQAKSVLQVFGIAGALFGITIVVVIPNALYLKIIPTAEEIAADSDLAHPIAGAPATVGDEKLQVQHAHDYGTAEAATRGSRASQASVGSHTAPTNKWLDELVVVQKPAMRTAGKVLVVLGLLLSAGSFVLQIYETAHPSHDDDDSSSPSRAPTAPNHTTVPRNFTVHPAFDGVAGMIAP